MFIYVASTVTKFLDIVHHPNLIKEQHFGDWDLHLSSGKTYYVEPN
jgi:hypothetical protein